MDHTPSSSPPVRRGGYTLVEMLVAAGIVGILMLGLQSAVLVASRAVPDRTDANLAVIAEARALNEIAAEVHYAATVATPDSRTLRVTVPDQDGDGAGETITFAWSGTAGDPLTRQRNAGTPAAITDGLASFSLASRSRAVSTTTQTYGTQTGNEVLLASFNDYGLSGTTTGVSYLSSNDQLAEYFRFYSPTVPANAVSVQITRASVVMASLGLGGNAIAEICRANGNGDVYPTSYRIGSASTWSLSLIPLSLGWVDFNFTDVVLDAPYADLILRLKGTSSFSTASVQFRENNTAPWDTYKLMWTNNGGVSWSPSSGNLNRNDIRFAIYGKITTPTVTHTVTTRTYLTGLDLRLRLSAQSGGGSHLSIEVPNEPEIVP